MGDWCSSDVSSCFLYLSQLFSGWGSELCHLGEHWLDLQPQKNQTDDASRWSFSASICKDLHPASFSTTPRNPVSGTLSQNSSSFCYYYYSDYCYIVASTALQSNGCGVTLVGPSRFAKIGQMRNDTNHIHNFATVECTPPAAWPPLCKCMDLSNHLHRLVQDGDFIYHLDES